MSEWQALYAGAFILVLALAKPDMFVARVMAANFLGSAILGGDVLAVGVLDLLCIVLLIGRGTTAHIVAFGYCLMLPAYVLGRVNGWPLDATYAIVEAIGYAQLLVMGNVGGGMGGRIRAAIRRRPVFGRSMAGRPVSSPSVGRNTEVVRKAG